MKTLLKITLCPALALALMIATGQSADAAVYRGRTVKTPYGVAHRHTVATPCGVHTSSTVATPGGVKHSKATVGRHGAVRRTTAVRR